MQRVAHAPAHDAPTEDIEYDGEVQKPRHRRDIRDVRDPELIRRGRAKRPFHEIGGRWSLRGLPPWLRQPTPLGDALQAVSAQQASDTLLAHVMAGVAQIAEQAWCAVGAVRSRMGGANDHSQFEVASRSWRQGPLPPRVVAALRYAQHSTHRRHGS